MLKTVGFPSTRTGDQTIVDGNLVIGTAGKGIDFSATSGAGTSELLDDYEEGTWTPYLFPNVSGSISLSTASGHYVKVGNLVTLTANIVVSSVSAPVGNVYVNGFPFSTSGVPSSSIILAETNPFTGTPRLNISPAFALIGYVDVTGTTQGTAGLYKAGTIVNFYMSYTV